MIECSPTEHAVQTSDIESGQLQMWTVKSMQNLVRVYANPTIQQILPILSTPNLFPIWGQFWDITFYADFQEKLFGIYRAAFDIELGERLGILVKQTDIALPDKQWRYYCRGANLTQHFVIFWISPTATTDESNLNS